MIFFSILGSVIAVIVVFSLFKNHSGHRMIMALSSLERDIHFDFPDAEPIFKKEIKPYLSKFTTEAIAEKKFYTKDESNTLVIFLLVKVIEEVYKNKEMLLPVKHLYGYYLAKTLDTFRDIPDNDEKQALRVALSDTALTFTNEMIDIYCMELMESEMVTAFPENKDFVINDIVPHFIELTKNAETIVKIKGKNTIKAAIRFWAVRCMREYFGKNWENITPFTFMLYMTELSQLPTNRSRLGDKAYYMTFRLMEEAQEKLADMNGFNLK